MSKKITIKISGSEMSPRAACRERFWLILITVLSCSITQLVAREFSLSLTKKMLIAAGIVIILGFFVKFMGRATKARFEGDGS